MTPIEYQVRRSAHRPMRRNDYQKRPYSQRIPTRTMTKRPDDIIPPIDENIRVIPLGGVEEIGKNMTAIEYGDDIIVIDAGFQFKDDDTPGVDYILPNRK